MHTNSWHIKIVIAFCQDVNISCCLVELTFFHLADQIQISGVQIGRGRPKKLWLAMIWKDFSSLILSSDIALIGRNGGK